MSLKHPYHILVENISKYSKVLKEKDIEQIAQNTFTIRDEEFNKLSFFQDVEEETKVKPIEHEYIGANCSDPHMCFKPWDVFGFDNVLFYFKSKKY